MKTTSVYLFAFLIIVIVLDFIVTMNFVNDLESEKTIHQTTIVLNLQRPAPERDTIHLQRATTYQPTFAQCDSNPFGTADGSIINPDSLQRWIALSRDLIKRWGGPFDYGDTIEFYSATKPHINGDWVLHDCMASKYKMSVDFLMSPENNYPKLGIGTDVKIIYCGEYMY